MKVKKKANVRKKTINEHKSSKLKEKEKVVCAICLDIIKEENICNPSNCNHEFCFTCLLKWDERSSNCPICRERFGLILTKNTPTLILSFFTEDIPSPRSVEAAYIYSKFNIFFY